MWCMRSCNSTLRSRAAGHSRADSGSTTRFRRMPHASGIGTVPEILTSSPNSGAGAARRSNQDVRAAPRRKREAAATNPAAYRIGSYGIDRGTGAVAGRIVSTVSEASGAGAFACQPPHGTATPAGDIVELNALRAVFGSECPPLSSTKALSGHSLGAASVHEAIYCLLMLRDGFLAGSANIAALDPGAQGFPLLRQSREQTVDAILSNSFGFGGTNGCLVFARA